jgi:Flp pilus assembly protein TadG
VNAGVRRDMGRSSRGMRNRRGAIVVMTGIFIVALMLITAISVDASRIFAAKNELQTAADAAALAGALQLLDDASTAADSARAYARRNHVEQRLIDSVEIRHGVWRPSERVFIVDGNPADAVRVTIHHALPMSLARVFGDSTVTLSSSAIAWSSAPVAESACAKPLAMPYSELLRSLGYPEGFDFDLTDEDIQRLREMPEADRYTHFHYGDPNLGEGPTSHYTRAQYFPIDIDSTWNRSDPTTSSRPTVEAQSFQSYIVGPLTGPCSRTVSPNDSVRSEPGNKRDALLGGLSQICASLGGTLTGSPMTCRPTAGGSSIGLPLKVIFWDGEMADWAESGARAMLRARMTGSFILTEFKWQPADSSGTGQHARMAGHWDVKRDFGPLSATSASMLLRPVLVR